MSGTTGELIDPRFQPVVEEARRQVAEGLRPSLQLSVEWRGRRVLDFACGDASPDSSYLLWSTTKPFVAVTLLQIVDEGGASLDDRVSRYLPEFGTGGKEKATLAHLLTHRGGFPDSSPELRRAAMRASKDWNEALAFVCGLPAAWEPGTDRGYHPFSGWLILGELVQRLDGRPLPESLRARVLDPLGIPEDGFSLGRPELLRGPPLEVVTRDERGAPDAAEVHYWNDPRVHAAVIPSAGGISRAGETIKLFSALLRGGVGSAGRVLSDHATRLATFPWVVGLRDRTFLRDIPWGLGLHLKHVVPSLDDCGASATPGTFGHGGHFLVNTAWADPGKDLATCILSNGLTESRAGIAGVQALSQAIHEVVDGSAA